MGAVVLFDVAMVAAVLFASMVRLLPDYSGLFLCFVFLRIAVQIVPFVVLPGRLARTLPDLPVSNSPDDEILVNMSQPYCYYRKYDPIGFRYNRIVSEMWGWSYLDIALGTVYEAYEALQAFPLPQWSIVEYVGGIAYYSVIVGSFGFCQSKVGGAEQAILNSDAYWQRFHQDCLAQENALYIKQQTVEAERRSRQMDKIISSSEGRRIGQQIINKNYYTITASGHANVSSTNISGDYLRDSVKILGHNDPALEDALTVFAGYVQAINNKEAELIFNDFNRNVQQGSGMVTLRSIWRGLIEVVPDAVKLSEAAITIAKRLGLNAP
jgi:hypothetical protein